MQRKIRVQRIQHNTTFSPDSRLDANAYERNIIVDVATLALALSASLLKHLGKLEGHLNCAQ
jgi:hypothetical protein